METRKKTGAHRQVGCDEHDGIHQSVKRRGHACWCGLSQGHGPVHVCPSCKRHWGHPEVKLKATPHAGPKVRRFAAVKTIQPLR